MECLILVYTVNDSVSGSFKIGTAVGIIKDRFDGPVPWFDIGIVDPFPIVESEGIDDFVKPVDKKVVEGFHLFDAGISKRFNLL